MFLERWVHRWTEAASVSLGAGEDRLRGGGAPASDARWRRLAGGSFLAGSLLLSCSGGPTEGAACRGSSGVALGVVWPALDGGIDLTDGARTRQVLARARELTSGGSPDLRSTLELARVAAEVGDPSLSVEAARAGLALAPADPRASSMAAAALLARSLATGSVDDLLDAGELLAGRSEDPAARCNRLLVLDRLALCYRYAEAEADCACAEAPGLAARPDEGFPLDGRRYSADELSPSELGEVEELLARGYEERAGGSVFGSSQAWRVWLMGDALELWRAAPSGAGRRAVEERVRPLAELYGATTGNPAPGRLWAELGDVAPRDAPAVSRALVRWRDGMAALARYQPERVRGELEAARGELAPRLPALLPSIDLALAGAQYHLGDDRGMLERSLAIRRSVARDLHPWAWARALWLEAVALQATADWSESLRRAGEAGRIYTELGETANAGYLDTVRGFALDSQGAEEAASAAYLAATTKTREAGDTRLLAGALALWARQQSRTGRPQLALDLQRESTILDTADATPQLVAEAKAVLAEQLFRAGERSEGERVLTQAREAAADIESTQPRRRAEAIVAQVEALALAEADPAAAERALGRFLDEFAAFGERFFRAEALIDRAEARLRLGKLPGAEDDLAAALEEIASQSQRLEDRVQSLALLDRAREALDLLVAVLLRKPGGAEQALGWIEALRNEQIGLGFGPENARPETGHGLLRAPSGACVTQFWAAPTELLSWTSCDGAPPRLARTEAPRDRLLRDLAAFREAARRGRLDEIRRRSAAASAWLVAPNGNELSESVSWTVIPDALFPAVPMAWLTLDDRFLFEDRAVQVASSWSRLEAAPIDPVASWRGLGIGDPEPGPEAPRARLPLARAEVERLPALFSGSVALVGRRATWGALLDHQERGSFNLLHIATHVSTGSRVPLSARLELAPEPGLPDGRISADDVARVRLPGLRLAVFASCSSATAAPGKLAGSLDFAHALVRAGADEVLGTLWDVPDREISVAVGELYDGLEAGLAPRQALRAVWLAGLSEPMDPHGVQVRASLQLTGTHP